jgi:hypothetical protein
VCGLEYASNLAVSYQRPFVLMASADGNWFKILDDRYKTDPNPHHNEDPPVTGNGIVINPLDKKWYNVDFDASPYRGVDIAAVPAGGNVVFFPDGHAAETDVSFVLGLGPDQKTVTVNGPTGRVSVN